MKRAAVILLSAALAGLCAACASSGSAALRDSKTEPIALVSVVSNGDINWQDEEPLNPSLVGPFARRVLREDPDKAIVSDAAALIGRAETLFREHMASSGLITLAEKETVLGSAAYGAAKENRYQINREEVKPADYRYVDYRDKGFPPALAAETGIQRTMYLEFAFTKAMSSGLGKNGSCRADVEMTVTVRDVRAKTLYKRTFSLWSRDAIKVSSGVYSQQELMGLFDSVITDACYDFLDHLAY